MKKIYGNIALCEKICGIINSCNRRFRQADKERNENHWIRIH
ncbi:hypothetical protein HMPREF3033_00632 [Veillonellaceae bacterium DNF00751]|nr:hypothetical protein HMPREF3033_00632 [Veillonellaceae bacterium DNF00751]